MKLTKNITVTIGERVTAFCLHTGRVVTGRVVAGWLSSTPWLVGDARAYVLVEGPDGFRFSVPALELGANR